MRGVVDMIAVLGVVWLIVAHVGDYQSTGGEKRLDHLEHRQVDVVRAVEEQYVDLSVEISERVDSIANANLDEIT